jgi:serine protease Do
MKSPLRSIAFASIITLSSLSSPLILRTSAESEAQAGIEQADLLSRSFEQVADKITSSVVTISAVVKAKPSKKRMRPGGDPSDPFRDFSGDDFFERFFPDQGQGGGAPQQGMGTGVIIDNQGHIITNNHVIAGADEVNVKLHNEKTYKAKVIGTDPKTDLAVVKIQAPDLSPAALGDSDKLRIGEWVVAAGNPFGLSNTITAGIVSAKGRSFMGGGQFEDFIQTDAAINPGNSGGPLVNLRGEVIGINTAIFSRSGGYMGIGFAIPVNMAKNVVTSLMKSGKVVRGWLGVGIQPVTEQAATSFNYSSNEGALVGHVQSGSPAEKGGLKQGDIITALNGDKVCGVNELRNTIANLTPGTSLTVTYFRDGKERTLTVKIGELKGSPEEGASPEAESTVDIGITVENLTERLAKQIGSERSDGVVVLRVQPGSIAEEAGIQSRDVIVTVNGKPVKDVAQYNRLIEQVDLSKGARLVVETQGMERFVFLKGE